MGKNAFPLLWLGEVASAAKKVIQFLYEREKIFDEEAPSSVFERVSNPSRRSSHRQADASRHETLREY